MNQPKPDTSDGRGDKHSNERASMSWQGYVDQQLLGTGFVNKAAIIGLNGGIWAQSAGFAVLLPPSPPAALASLVAARARAADADDAGAGRAVMGAGEGRVDARARTLCCVRRLPRSFCCMRRTYGLVSAPRSSGVFSLPSDMVRTWEQEEKRIMTSGCWGLELNTCLVFVSHFDCGHQRFCSCLPRRQRALPTRPTAYPAPCLERVQHQL